MISYCQHLFYGHPGKDDNKMSVNSLAFPAGFSIRNNAGKKQYVNKIWDSSKPNMVIDSEIRQQVNGINYKVTIKS